MDVLTPATTAAEITARLDRLPMTRHLWKMVTLISLGGCVEVYALFFSGYARTDRHGGVRRGLLDAERAGRS